MFTGSTTIIIPIILTVKVWKVHLFLVTNRYFAWVPVIIMQSYAQRTKSQLTEQTFLSGEHCCSPHSTAICSFGIHRCLEEWAWRPGDNTPRATKERQHTRKRRRARHHSVYIAIKTQQVHVYLLIWFIPFFYICTKQKTTNITAAASWKNSHSGSLPPESKDTTCWSPINRLNMTARLFL